MWIWSLFHTKQICPEYMLLKWLVIVLSVFSFEQVGVISKLAITLDHVPVYIFTVSGIEHKLVVCFTATIYIKIGPTTTKSILIVLVVCFHKIELFTGYGYWILTLNILQNQSCQMDIYKSGDRWPDIQPDMSHATCQQIKLW